jgi:hypothetical protein
MNLLINLVTLLWRQRYKLEALQRVIRNVRYETNCEF